MKQSVNCAGMAAATITAESCISGTNGIRRCIFGNCENAPEIQFATGHGLRYVCREHLGHELYSISHIGTPASHGISFSAVIFVGLSPAQVTEANYRFFTHYDPTTGSVVTPICYNLHSISALARWLMQAEFLANTPVYIDGRKDGKPIVSLKYRLDSIGASVTQDFRKILK